MLTVKKIPTDFIGRIKALVDDRCKGNQSEAARLLGVSHAYVNFIYNGKMVPIEPKKKTLAALNIALGIMPEKDSSSGIPVHPVKIYGMAQALGLRIHSGDIIPDNDSDLPEIYVAMDPSKSYVAFRVEGDSMFPEYPDGCVVVCDCKAEPQNGKVVAAKFDGTVVVKRYRRVGDTILLTSDNPKAGKDYELHASDIEWNIKVVIKQQEVS